LDELLTLLTTTPRIKEAAEIGELAKSLAVRIQSDANINCVMTAACCMEALAKGLMGSFGRYREAVVPPMLERLKERKVNVTDAIGAALDAVFTAVSDLTVTFACAYTLINTSPLSIDNLVRYCPRRITLTRIQKPSSQRRDTQVSQQMSLKCYNSSPSYTTQDHC
jgi:cytoskeleton-associated protein 5